MTKILEAYGDEASAKDGGFVFQAIVSHSIKWEIVNGETRIDPKQINAVLHQVDIFPDIKFTEGHATLNYVILSEVNLLKRKFELASEAIKKRLNLEYAEELKRLNGAGTILTANKKHEVDAKYFANTYYEVTLSTNRLVLREVSTSGLNSGSPRIVLKVSTGMVDSLDGAAAPTWDAFSIKAEGLGYDLIIKNDSDPIASIKEYDEVEKIEDVVFRTIVPSLILEFKGDRIAIDTYSNRSALITANVNKDYVNLFNVEDETKHKPAESSTENK